VLAGVGALLSGCGGGDSQSSTVAVTTDPSISQAEYQQQANAICTDAKTEAVQIALERAKEAGKTSVQELPPAELTEVFLAGMNKQLAGLSELDAPPKDQAEVEAFLNAFKEAVDKIEEEGLEGQEEIQPALVPIREPAEAYGLPGCTYGS
jgi:hypothetical protein